MILKNPKIMPIIPPVLAKAYIIVNTVRSMIFYLFDRKKDTAKYGL